jgi:energy-coupling factor transporter ATP-binding protein EcfA2
MNLVIHDIQKKFDKKEVLKGASFTFEKGKIYGLLGRNGAGKTTLFNCINEDIPADGGTFQIEENGTCDHSMLAYRFYRQPKAILALFTERLKSISIINFMPASVLALGLAFLLFFSGGTQNPLNYVVIVLSIFAMSVFFSVHTLVLYYLLQPYNANMEIKNPIYEIINTITYLVCYFAAGKAVSTLVFGIGVTLFCILYVAAALVLAYRLAPKTFKLRQ